MEDVKFKIGQTGTGSFYIQENNEELAQMIISISGKILTAHHTEVYPKGEGKGMGKRLLDGLTDYARKNGLKVIALCPFVHAQFKKHPEAYKDILTSSI
jgi:predicted GNAT family acetyltransferase